MNTRPYFRIPRPPCPRLLCLAAVLLAGCSPSPSRASPSPPAAPSQVDRSPASTPPPTARAPLAATPITRPTGTAVVVTRGSPARRRVLLTFDAGADTGFAVQILDELKEAAVTATFGVTGRWAEQNPALVRRIVAEGHSIVNHTYDHTSFTGVSPHTGALPADRRIAEITRADRVLTELAGHDIKPWFRLPYGDSDADVGAQVLQAGYRYVLGWTVDSLGWQGLSAAAITARCLGRAAPGAIFLFHVGSRSQDATALPGIIQSLKDQGYGFDAPADIVP